MRPGTGAATRAGRRPACRAPSAARGVADQPGGTRAGGPTPGPSYFLADFGSFLSCFGFFTSFFRVLLPLLMAGSC